MPIPASLFQKSSSGGTTYKKPSDSLGFLYVVPWAPFFTKISSLQRFQEAAEGMLVVGDVVTYSQEARGGWIGQAGGNADICVAHGLGVIVTIAYEHYFVAKCPVTIDDVFLTQDGLYSCYLVVGGFSLAAETQASKDFE